MQKKTHVYNPALEEEEKKGGRVSYDNVIFNLFFFFC